MRRRTFAILGLAAAAALSASLEARAQTLSNYTSTPPFISATVAPNILLLLDNSGSMNSRAYQTAFDTATTYYGIFDPTECYQYGSDRFQPDSASNPSTPGTCGASYPWSGNLLNYVSMRRMDMAKWVMTGGICSVARDASGYCTRFKGQDSFSTGACCRDQTQTVTNAQATGRMDATYIPGGGGDVSFHIVGSNANLRGYFCVDNDTTAPGSGDADCAQDGGGYTETRWKIEVDWATPQGGIIQQVGTRARFGLMEFKGAGDGGQVLADVGSSVATVTTAIDTTVPSTWTPLAESLYEATRYFMQIAPAYGGSDYSYTDTTRDPYYFTSPTWSGTAQYVNCCKSYVIIFTDGQPTQDLNVPSSIRDYAHAAMSHGTSDHCTSTAGCTNGYASHASNNTAAWHNNAANSNHHDNCTTYYGGTTSDPCNNNGSHYLDDVAYYAHTNDLRQTTVPVLGGAGKDLSGMQNLTIYTFFAFGTGSNLLSDAAKAGGFEDRNANNVPDLPEEYDRVNNTTGAAGADGVPDTYFVSDNADNLHDRLLAAITSILQKSASGTSVSVLATSATAEGSLYQAFFFPSTFEGVNDIKWTGFTQGLFLDSFGNVREDTDGDGKMILANDKIIKARYDTATGDVKVDRYHDNDGNGQADSVTPYETIGLKEVKSIWEAGKRLAFTDSSARKLITWVDGDNDGVVDTGEQMYFTAANVSTLSPYLRPSAAPFTATNIINWVRGDQITGMRDRQLTVTDGVTTAVRVWKLGDPIHSTPTIVGAPKERYDLIYGDASYQTFYTQYRNRRWVAYVGANDGMLHAFNAGFYHRGDDTSTSGVIEHGRFTRDATGGASGPLLGQELWGFIPNQLLPQLRWLTQGDYTHVYYVDLKPKVTDARIFTPDADHPGGWGTILIGGMRMGGSCRGAVSPAAATCVGGTGAPPMSVTADFGSGVQTRNFYSAYFVLDVTNPEVDPKLLWVFTDESLGLTTSYPAIVRMNPDGAAKTDNTNAKWFMVVGSGPTGYDGISGQTGQLFAMDLATGPINPSTGTSQLSKFPTSDASSFMGNLITLDSELDYRTDVAYVGNNYNNGASPQWAGKLYRLMTRGCTAAPCTTAAWGVLSGGNRAPSVLLSSFPTAGTYKVGPVVAAPTVTSDDTGKIWVFFGSGRFFSNADKTNTEQQYFFGVKDPVVTNGCTDSSVTGCEKKNLLNVSGVTVCVTCATGTNQVTGIAGVTQLEGNATTTLQGLIQTMDGWYTTMPTSLERVVVSPTILGGIIYFPSFIPSTDICAASGTGYLYALFYLTGSAYKESVIGTTVVGSNTNVLRSMALGTAGLASQMAVHIGAQGSGAAGTTSSAGCAGRITGFMQSSTGTLSQFCTKPAYSSWSRYVSWINQRE
jgi:type IV pilus assembly protein PilY1